MARKCRDEGAQIVQSRKQYTSVVLNAARRNVDFVIEHAQCFRIKFKCFTLSALGSYAYGQYSKECIECEKVSNFRISPRYIDIKCPGR